MRKELVIFIIVVVVGMLVAYNRFGSAPLIFQSIRGVAGVPDAPAPELQPVHLQARQVVDREPSLTRQRKQGNDEPLPVFSVLPSRRVIGATDCCRLTELPFPIPETMKTGSSAAEVRAVYGEPALEVTTTAHGRVVDKYYYFSAERDHLTLANIENGKLVSAESLPSPYFHGPVAKTRR